METKTVDNLPTNLNVAGKNGRERPPRAVESGATPMEDEVDKPKSRGSAH